MGGGTAAELENVHRHIYTVLMVKQSEENHPLGIPLQPKSNKKMLYGLILLVVLMFVMTGLIIWQI